jgi:beta-N-acetylhexosaminidase
MKVPVTTVRLMFAGLLIVCCLLVFAGDASQVASSKYLPYNRTLSRAEQRWIEETLKGMTRDEKIGQLMAADANAVFMNRESEAHRNLVHNVVNNKVGTLILFRSDVWASAILTNRLQQMAKVPLLVSADLEMGPGMRFNDTEWWAPNMAVAATGSPAWARRQGEMTAIEARAIGINWLYAPVADVNNNPDNPVINTRSYGENPQTVATYVKAFVEGAQAAGILSTAKHFPGHGDTATDSHIGLPVVDVDRSRLEKIELVPFRAAIAAGAGSVMTAHIAMPRIEPKLAPAMRALTDRERDTAEFVAERDTESGKVTLPGTLSSRVLTGLLREDLAFKGIITTDAMSMAGITARFDPGQAAVLAIQAGADIVLKSPDVDASVLAIRKAVESGAITEQRLDASVRRIIEAKARLGLHVRRQVPINEIDRVVSSPQSLAIAQEIADRSITVVRDEKRLLPLDSAVQNRILHVTITDDEDRNVMTPLLNELRKRGLSLDQVVIDGKPNGGTVEEKFPREKIERASVILVSVAVRARSGKGSVALPGAGDRVIELLGASGRPVIAITFGNPYLLKEFKGIETCLAAYGVVAVSQRAAARAITGEIDINGKLPVSIPELYVSGHGLQVGRRK